MLQAENIQFAYDEKTKLQFPDIHCQKGEQWLLLGQSGSGKTTLLHLLGGLMKAQEGHIKIADTDIATLSASQLDHFRGRNIGIIFQKSHFVRALTVEENLVLAQDLAGIKIDRQRIKVLLDRLNIGHKLQAKTDALSIGEQQRVAIARALVNRPKIILADEPTSALDDHNCDEVIRLLEQQAKEEAVTLLIVTHDGRLKNKFDHQIHLQKQL